MKSVGLSDRYKDLLTLLVSDYIASAQPVGSETLAKRYPRRISPATIRNIMADLEVLGLVTHPYPSAGRMPTPQGLRYYVDTLMAKKELSEPEKAKILGELNIPEASVPSILQRTSKILATLSHHVGWVVAPKAEQLLLKHVEFLALSRGRLLGIFVSNSGMVENRIIETSEEWNFSQIEKMNHYCNRAFLGLTLEEAREKIFRDIVRARQEYDEWLVKILSVAGDFLNQTADAQVYLEGQTKGFETLWEKIEALEEKQELLYLLDRTREAEGVKVFIGAEAGLEELGDVGMIVANYREGNHVLGTLGVIGPARMDYEKLVSVVDFTSKLMSDLLANS